MHVCLCEFRPHLCNAKNFAPLLAMQARIRAKFIQTQAMKRNERSYQKHIGASIGVRV